MSLLVWMPLNGNLTNQGLGSVSFYGSTSEYSDVTKFNKSLNLRTANIGFTVPELANQRIFSVAFWIYCQADSSYKNDWNCAIALHDGGSGLRFESCYGSSLRALSFHNNITNKLTLASRILAQDKDRWYHVALVCDGTKIYSYTDGVNTFIDDAVGGALTGNVTMNGGRYYGFMNDLRIYDHALSNKEVEELSKGLYCHYPLNDPYCTSVINKYANQVFEGKPSAHSSLFTMSKLTDERGYNFKLNYVGTGSDMWASIQYPEVSFTAGKIYDFSIKVRMHKTNTVIVFRAARMNNDYATTSSVKIPSVVNEEWTEYHTRIKLDATSVKTGTTYTTKPLVELYTASLPEKGTTYLLDFDIKDVQISECESDAPATDGAFVDNTVYDTSGLGNNGIVSNSEYITINGDSPMNSISYKFMNGGRPYILTPDFSFEKMTEGTISLWINRHSTDDTWRSFLFFANAFNWTGGGYDFIIIGSTGSQAIAMDCCSNVVISTPDLNKWYMYTITWDLKSHTAVYYINGSRVQSKVDSKIDTTYASKHSSHYIGSTSYDKTDYSLSDFRLYSKALSASQVMELYNTPVSISNNGTMFTKGEFVE